MKDFTGEGYGRVVILELVRGELLIESIEEKLAQMGIKNAVILSSVGSLQKIVYHRPTDFSAAAADEEIVLEEPFEIGSLTGSIIDGVAHLHFVAASPSGVYGGHLEPKTEVLYLFEVVIAEINGFNLERKLTPEKVKMLFEKQ
jgi:predicted DNA-binding protein with PD1-like motif